MSYLVIIIGLVIIILVHELGHFLSAKFFGVKVEEFGVGFPPRIWGKKIGETLYSLNWIPFGGFVRIAGELPDSGLNKDPDSNPVSPEDKKRLFSSQKIWKRSAVISAGVIMNVISAWVLFSFIFIIGVPSSVIVTDISPDSPAATAGIMPGDKILNFADSSSFISFLDANAGQVVSFQINRSGENMNLSVLSRANVSPSVGHIGAALVDSGIPKSSFLGSFYESAKFTASSIYFIILAFFSIFQSLFAGVAPNVVGPIGIFSIASVVSKSGFIYIIHLVGLISLNLAVLNILPFPALDGGRLAFLLAEKIKGSPLPPKFELWTNAVGFSLLILLMALVTTHDLLRLF